MSDADTQRGGITPPITPRLTSVRLRVELGRDLMLELVALSHIDTYMHNTGRSDCPNWMIPASIPTQRLTGLKRRGYLEHLSGYWWLTKEGDDYLADLEWSAA